MKILMSAYASNPGRGSEDGKGWNFPLNVAKLGHEVWVLTSPFTASYKNNKSSIEEALRDNPLPNLHFVYVDIQALLKRLINIKEDRISNKVGVYLHYLLWQKKAYKVAEGLNLKHDFDVIHHVNYGSLVFGSELWRVNKPFIFGPVGAGQTAPPAFKDFFLDAWKAEERRSFMVKNLARFNFIAARTVKNADLVLIENRETLDLLNKMGGAKRTKPHLSCGLPPEYFSKDFPIREPSTVLRLLWVARLSPRKGLRLALQALAAVKSTVFYKMTILGDGPLKPHISAWLQEFQLEDKVEYRGYLPWLKVKEEYLQNDVFLFSSLRDTFGSQLLEAMAHGLPIIALDHHGARDFLPSTVAIKVPAKDPNETVQKMAQAVEYMFENPEKRIEMGKAGFLFVKSFSWEEKAKSMAAFYEEVKDKGTS
ncbi:glycosyltransferase family 4 protein [Pseudanabaena sp. FACHB-2040]|uniref:glycosyltransferase family 4 protein n=1 Tax=Pseudanabaena sp. FACHB-2040 TaxID=2692859 RepID=UPI00168495E2|nr:glycosyltransferase family 4 protein [Pseudanabaena sp. FACHB-2040]MBD2260591.1 glycosyltransferase family 4 protein [Pseudanabaena sp. FACHB-2040]